MHFHFSFFWGCAGCCARKSICTVHKRCYCVLFKTHSKCYIIHCLHGYPRLLLFLCQWRKLANNSNHTMRVCSVWIHVCRVVFYWLISWPKEYLYKTSCNILQQPPVHRRIAVVGRCWIKFLFYFNIKTRNGKTKISVQRINGSTDSKYFIYYYRVFCCAIRYAVAGAMWDMKVNILKKKKKKELLAGCADKKLIVPVHWIFFV